MIVAQHEVLGRIFKSDTSRTGRSMAHADHSIAMPLRTMKKIDRPSGTEVVFSLDSRHFVPGYFHSVPPGRGAFSLDSRHFYSVPPGQPISTRVPQPISTRVPQADTPTCGS
jgi:hypothetical protein